MGFLADAGTVLLLTKWAGWGDIPAQSLGFVVAVTVTWIINRSWTFAEHASERWLMEWLRYMIANSFGAAINNGVYIALVLTTSQFTRHPVLAVAAGSMAGMGINFLASKKLIFISSTMYFPER